MDNMNLIETFSEFKELKNIDRATMMSVLEDVFRNVLIRQFGSDENFDIIINVDKGDLEIWRNRVVVEDDDLEDPSKEIRLSDAKKIDTDYEVGEDVTDEVKLADFGRVPFLTCARIWPARSWNWKKITSTESIKTHRRYHNRRGISGLEKGDPWYSTTKAMNSCSRKSEQIPSDFFRKGDSVRAVVIKVELRNNTPLIILSRTSPIFLERFFELEIPEIFDGLITIKKIVRMPGERAKVAVESYDERIDPVGACVGMKGSRIHGIVRELRNENIDVVNFSSNLQLFIRRALSPAKISPQSGSVRHQKKPMFT
jgi:transcription termination/antitermination protein NusA